MAKKLEDEIEYYYDSHPTGEDLVSEAARHAKQVFYLVMVLQWLFRQQLCVIHHHLRFYQTQNPNEEPLAPDVAVIKGIAYQDVKSWRVGRTGPAPQAVFEIASEETWPKDLEEKPSKYAAMGVREYFTYDPHVPQVWKSINSRLLGWRFDASSQAMGAIPADQQGRLWSQELLCFLGTENSELRLYDEQNKQCLTGEEALAKEKETLAKRAEALAEKLRALGVHPDEI